MSSPLFVALARNSTTWSGFPNNFLVYNLPNKNIEKWGKKYLLLFVWWILYPSRVGLPFDENFPAFWRKIHSTAKWRIFLSCYENMSTILPNDENPRTEEKSLHPAKWRKKVIPPKKTTQKTIKKPLLLLGTCRMQNCPPYLWPPKVAKVLFLGAFL